MSKINANIADYLTQIERLTNTNLSILKSLNDSFFTKKNHIYAEVDETTYVIPSFLSLENKINALQENFENLVKSPETCEAYFNFDGNTRSIEVRKYSHVPNEISIPTITNFGIDGNDIFKDFMTPVPYINLDLPYLPNDIVEVNVKKIVPKTESLKSLFKNKLSYQVETKDNAGNITYVTAYNTSINEKYGDIYKLLLNYKEDYDYVEYDTIYKLPIRKNIGTGTYVIESVVSDIIDEDLNELITLKLRNNLSDSSYTNTLSYKLFDDTIEKPLQVGDELINYDGTGKVVITDIRPSTSTITVKVVNGEYLNFLGTDSYDTYSDKDIHDLSKIRFYATIDFDADKYVKIPLEEDQYVFIAVAPINSRMNLQASWGTGLVLDTHALVNNIDDTKSFKTYYDNNVKNIGDVLYEITSMITSPITKLSESTFKNITSLKPELKHEDLNVVQINKHLNNSTTVKNIREAYNQKKIAEQNLNEIQQKIDDLTNRLNALSFNDASGMRSMYTSQINSLNNNKNIIVKTINDAINTISVNVNSAEIPIENAKYRIRGFYVPSLKNVDNLNLNNHVIGIKVQYRYKNLSTDIGNAISLNSSNGETYIYSDWNNLPTFNKEKLANCVDGVYLYDYEPNNEKINEPSFNQIDIPISQGESVDIRLKVLYDFGQPHVQVLSDWSDILNIKFPDEYTKDVPVLSIIEENNNDIETNRFNNIIKDNGITDHVDDMIVDQSKVYYHKPDSIASGFYTDERRVIPLKDKLQSMTNDIAELKNEILSSTNSNLIINAVIGNSSTILYPNNSNIITLEAYNNFTASSEIDGPYIFKNGVVSTVVNIILSNSGDNIIKLYPIFPGNKDININNSSAVYANKSNYCNGTDEGVWFKYQHENSDTSKLQTQNQFITFRINDLWTGTPYYSANVGVATDNVQNSNIISNITEDSTIGMVAYPYLTSSTGLCINTDFTHTYMTINPGEEIIVPIYCEYVVNEPNKSIKKTLSFDVRTSLYSDPVNYSFSLVGKNTASFQDKLIIANKKRFWENLTSPLRYKVKLV